LDDFFIRALVAGSGVALVAGPLGCFIVWRRLAYFGDTLSHGALLGVALGLALEANLTLSIFIVSAATALIMVAARGQRGIASDALLGLLAHSALAIGLVVLAFITWVRVDLMGYLFGDILAVSRSDIAVIWGVAALSLGGLLFIWKPLFAATVDEDLATAEGLNPRLYETVFMLLIALVIAVAMKIVGALLITALLIIPAAAARQVSSTAEMMAVVAAALGVVSVFGGLYSSLAFDTPSGPSIVVAAVTIFLVNVLIKVTASRVLNREVSGHG
ncbi:MAG: metal ABC transporter permease, partial [Pseudomonadota bacterium]